jgi:hypothetical protein
MARIKCRTPSTGKPLSINISNVETTYVTVVEAPDFSVPDAAGNFANRDPEDSTRAIRPGEVFFLTPMSVRNKGITTSSIQVSIIPENSNTAIEVGTLKIPAGDTGFVPLQGRSLLKRDLESANGDILQIKAQNSNTLDIWISAEEKLSSEHIGVE